MSRLAGVVLAWVVLGTAGCTTLTQLMVVVDSDLAVPGELDSIRITIRAPDGETSEAVANLVGERGRPLPRSLGLVYDGGALGPVVITVTGSVDGQDILQRRARVSFVPGEVRVLRMDLLRSCVGVRCTVDETCGEGGCRPRDVDANELAAWTGTVPRLDAAMRMDGGVLGEAGPLDGCVPRAEACNGEDDDCDRRADEDFVLDTDVRHCGACGNACPTGLANARSVCAGGECALACHPGWADCDGRLASGCETLLSAPSTCGACDVRCAGSDPLCADPGGGGEIRCVASCEPLDLTRCGGSCVDLATNALHCGECDRACPSRPGAVPTCEAGICSYRCEPGRHDCNGAAEDGCESELRELTSCGACGVACALPRAVTSCATGECRIERCEDGFTDCDPSLPGCESELATDPRHCGSCGNACPPDPANGATVCRSGACGTVCDAGWADCDGRADNGCESDLRSSRTCGSCGISCESEGAPLCAPDGRGGYACMAGCPSGETRCGETCADLSRDSRHCGACFAACATAPNAAAQCVGGECALACDRGFGNCDPRYEDGCETRLDTTTHCGACGTPCALDNASESCATGTCVLTGCATGWGDCNAIASDGCETPLGTTLSCRTCGDRCPTSAPNATGSVCTASGCQLACAAGWGDCNGSLADGCEAPLSTLSNCGACGSVCARDRAAASCATGSCRIASCNAGWGDCDLVDANGCERSLRTLTDCGSCGQVCALSRASETCETGACRIVACDAGWNDCDGLQPNGCETSLTTLTDCGSCGALCSLANSTETCSTLSCAISSCDPGWGDCDRAVSSGCETNLRTNRSHCGSCNAECLVAEECCGGACCDGNCCGGGCCPTGRTCCGTTCCGFGESCVGGVCRRMM